jgi:hypothetical protein
MDRRTVPKDGGRERLGKPVKQHTKVRFIRLALAMATVAIYVEALGAGRRF